VPSDKHARGLKLELLLLDLLIDSGGIDSGSLNGDVKVLDRGSGGNVPYDEGSIAIRQLYEGCGGDLISFISRTGGGGDGTEHPILAGGDALERDIDTPLFREGRVELSPFWVSEHGGAQGNLGDQEVESWLGVDG
jgi:hypothetical protein